MVEDKIALKLLEIDARLESIKENMMTHTDYQKVMSILNKLIKLAERQIEPLTNLSVK